jgi:hypothetical protein
MKHWVFATAVASGALLSGTAEAARAMWTGRMEQVTTVTYQIAWNCEYDYLGQRFWRVFQGSCPASVEVY